MIYLRDSIHCIAESRLLPVLSSASVFKLVSVYPIDSSLWILSSLWIDKSPVKESDIEGVDVGLDAFVLIECEVWFDSILETLPVVSVVTLFSSVGDASVIVLVTSVEVELIFVVLVSLLGIFVFRVIPDNVFKLLVKDEFNIGSAEKLFKSIDRMLCRSIVSLVKLGRLTVNCRLLPIVEAWLEESFTILLALSIAVLSGSSVALNSLVGNIDERLTDVFTLLLLSLISLLLIELLSLLVEDEFVTGWTLVKLREYDSVCVTLGSLIRSGIGVSGKFWNSWLLIGDWSRA